MVAKGQAFNLNVIMRFTNLLTSGLKQAGTSFKKFGDDADKAGKKVDRADKELGQFSKNLSFLRTYRNVFAGIIGTVAVKRFVEINSQFDTLLAKLEIVTGSTEKAANMFEDIQRFAKETPFTVDQTTTAMIKLLSRGLQPSIAALREFGDIASVLGTRLGGAQGGIMQVVEAVADLVVGQTRRFEELGISVQSMGDKIRFVFKGVQTDVDKTSDAIINFVRTVIGGEFSGAMLRQMDTLAGKFSILRDNISILIFQTGRAGINSELMKFLDTLINTVDDAGGHTSDFVNTVVMVLKTLNTALSFVIDNAKLLFTGVLTLGLAKALSVAIPFISKLTVVFYQLSAAIFAVSGSFATGGLAGGLGVLGRNAKALRIILGRLVATILGGGGIVAAFAAMQRSLVMAKLGFLTLFPVIGAVSIALGALTAAYFMYWKGSGKALTVTQKQTKANKEAQKSIRDQIFTVNNLASTYANLAEKTADSVLPRTDVQQGLFEKYSDQLSDLVDGFEDLDGATDLNTATVDRNKEAVQAHLVVLREQEKVLKEATRQLIIKDMEKEIKVIETLIDRINNPPTRSRQDTMSRFGGISTSIVATIEDLKKLEAQAEDTKKRLDIFKETGHLFENLAKDLGAAKTQFSELHKVVFSGAKAIQDYNNRLSDMLGLIDKFSDLGDETASILAKATSDLIKLNPVDPILKAVDAQGRRLALSKATTEQEKAELASLFALTDQYAKQGVNLDLILKYRKGLLTLSKDPDSLADTTGLNEGLREAVALMLRLDIDTETTAKHIISMFKGWDALTKGRASEAFVKLTTDTQKFIDTLGKNIIKLKLQNKELDASERAAIRIAEAEKKFAGASKAQLDQIKTRIRLEENMRQLLQDEKDKSKDKESEFNKLMRKTNETFQDRIDIANRTNQVLKEGGIVNTGLIKTENDLFILFDKGKINIIEYTTALREVQEQANLLDDVLMRNDALEDTISNTNSARDSLIDMTQALDEEIAIMGLVGKEREKAIMNQRIENLLIGANTEELQENISTLKKRLELVHQMEEAQNTAIGGIKAGLTQLGEEAKDSFGMFKRFAIDAFDEAEDRLLSFIETGKFEFKEFASFIIAELLRIQIKKNIIGNISNALNSFIGGIGSGGSATVSSSGGALVGGSGAADYGAVGFARPSFSGESSILNSAANKFIDTGQYSHTGGFGSLTSGRSSAATNVQMTYNPTIVIEGSADETTVDSIDRRLQLERERVLTEVTRKLDRGGSFAQKAGRR